MFYYNANLVIFGIKKHISPSPSHPNFHYLHIMATKFISDIAHYNEVLSKVAAVKRSLWIGTADIKDLHVKMGSATAPFLGLLAQLLKRGHRHEKRKPSEL